MVKEKEFQWREAQKIKFSIDLVGETMKHIDFLATVDQKQYYLYDGPMLGKAIQRYKACWLPLLAKHTESAIVKDPLVVPLDCEWIWHCHRLNPFQYRMDCLELYGRILDNKNIASILQELPRSESEEIWYKFYPDEPFELRIDALTDEGLNYNSEKCERMTYDLASAVKRQSSFYSKVSGPTMRDEGFINEAVDRYRAFLHLVRRNGECSYVPALDIDLVWHTHQLHPVSYFSDVKSVAGSMLGHDDTDAEKDSDLRVDIWFLVTTKAFEETFGLRYWKAGTINSPHLTSSFFTLPSDTGGNRPISSGTMMVEVFLEVVDIINTPNYLQKEKLHVLFTKEHGDALFRSTGKLGIFSTSHKKNVAVFNCEPTGELVLTVISDGSETIGNAKIPLEELTCPNSKHYAQEWLELHSPTIPASSTHIKLLVSLSTTIPVAIEAYAEILPPQYMSYDMENGLKLSWFSDEINDSGSQASFEGRHEMCPGDDAIMAELTVPKSCKTICITGWNCYVQQSYW